MAGIQLIDTFKYSGKKFLDLRQSCATLAELKATVETSIPDGFTKYCTETNCWYEYNSKNEEWEDTGRWRKVSPISEFLSMEYIFAIVDFEDNLLFGIRNDGEVVYNKGMSDEVRVRLDELRGIRTMHNENLVFAITDANGNVLFGINCKGEIIYDKGVPGEVKPILERLNRDLKRTMERMSEAESVIKKMKERLQELSGYKLMEDENFIFAITDPYDRLLFGIARDGKVVFDKGVPGEVQARFEELKGYQIMHDDNYLFALTDKYENVLFAVRYDGSIVMPKGIVRVLTFEEYTKEPYTPDTLYVIQGKKGRIEGAFINGRALSAGEEYAFICDANLLVYHGSMTVLPEIWIDHEAMRLMVEYPSSYSGPIFHVEDGMLFLI